MIDLPSPHPALLPSGLRDLLPPDAETEASAVQALMDTFAAHGYQRVKPPLLEFEDSLLAGSGAAVADQTFRLMDPDSNRMMGLRTDITPQVARIATTRLVHAPRPLRLSYAGQCLRVRGGQLAPDRQVAQAGIELIGHDSPEADAETVLVAAEAGPKKKALDWLMKFSGEQKRLLIYQIREDWFAFGPPAFQAEITERIARGEKPWAG